eukprot:gene15604-17176_t
MEAGYQQPGHRCFATEVVTSAPICISTLLPCGASSSKGQGRKSLYDFDNPNMADTTMVRATTGNVNTRSNYASSFSNPVKGGTGKHPSAGGKQLPDSGGLENFRKNLADKEISQTAAGLIAAARRSGSIYNYESSWGKCSSWCCKQEVDLFWCSINFVLDFLAEFYELN